MRGGAARGAVVLTILLAHVGFVALLMPDPIDVRRIQPEPMLAELLPGELPDQQSSFADALSIQSSQSTVEPPHLSAEAFSEPQVQAPRIDPELRLSSAAFASLAQLGQGEVVTAILLLQIAGDGAVISAEVVRSNGSAAANEAAIAYARATRWIAGSIDGESRPMQASLTVILGESA